MVYQLDRTLITWPRIRWTKTKGACMATIPTWRGRQGQCTLTPRQRLDRRQVDLSLCAMMIWRLAEIRRIWAGTGLTRREVIKSEVTGAEGDKGVEVEGGVRGVKPVEGEAKGGVGDKEDETVDRVIQNRNTILNSSSSSSNNNNNNNNNIPTRSTRKALTCRKCNTGSRLLLNSNTSTSQEYITPPRRCTANLKRTQPSRCHPNNPLTRLTDSSHRTRTTLLSLLPHPDKAPDRSAAEWPSTRISTSINSNIKINRCTRTSPISLTLPATSSVAR